MFKRCLPLLAAFAVVVSLVPGRAGAQAAGTRSQAYVLSGVNGQQFSVDDDIVLQLNGVTFYDDTPAYSGLRNPINFTAAPGAVLGFGVHDTYGFCNGLDPLVISCKGTTTYTPVTQGLVETCGFPPGDGGIVFSGTFTIPLMLPGCSSTSIAAVEVTQAIQQYQVLSDLEASLAANGEPPVPIVSKKPAVLRVYFANVTDVTQVSLVLSGVLSQTKSISLQPNCAPMDQRAGNRGCVSMDFYFTPPSGAWTADLVLNDASGNQIEHETLNFTSRDTAGLILKGITTCAIDPHTFVKTCGSGSQVYSLLQSTTALMPTASVSGGYDFGSIETYNLISPDPYYIQKIFATQADALYAGYDTNYDYYANTRTAHVAIYDPAGTPNSTAWTAYRGAHGLTIPNKFVTFGMDVTDGTLAHEVGHTLFLNHTNSVTPMTTTAPGCDHLAADSGTNYPFPNNYLQSTATTPEYGFNVATQTIINGYTNFELMGYCTPSWITPFQYKLMFPRLNGGTVSSPSGHPQPVAEDKGVTRAAAPPAVVNGQYWQVAGTVPASGLVLNPVFLETVPGTTDAGTGTYSIQVLGANGAALFTRAFTLNTTIGDPSAAVPATAPELTFFSQWIPYTAGAASFAVLDPNNNVLATLPITGVAPTVAFTNLGGLNAGGNVPVSWSITDPDSTVFTSRVVYSPDNGTNWYQVSQTAQTGAAAGAVTAGTDTIDFTQLPGSATALLRVYVSDGVNTGVATSAPFNVARHVPTSVAIMTPKSGVTQAAANPVLLTGSAFDPDDGFLSGKALVWSSDLQGALGTGSPLSVSLKAGTHTLTLTATDSDGNAISATAKITLGGGAPTVSLTTKAVTSACTNATIQAMTGAQGAALTAVQYSLNGGVNYTNIPLASLPYTFLVPGTGAVNLVARAYDASGQYAAQSTELTVTGTCVTQTLTALSGSGQLTPVTGAFALPLKAQLLDYAGNPVAGATVAFAAPAGMVASAALNPASAVTGADGTASTTATANAVAGSYSVSATTGTLTAGFSLTNTDFSIAAAQSSLNVLHGTSIADTITLTGLGGFNSSVTFSCTNLPKGVTCSFAPGSITPSGGTGTTVLTIATAANAMAANRAPLWPVGSAISVCGLLLVFRRRRRIVTVLALALAFAGFSALSGCGGFGAFTSSVTVNATAGTVVRTTPVSVRIY